MNNVQHSAIYATMNDRQFIVLFKSMYNMRNQQTSEMWIFVFFSLKTSQFIVY